MVGAGTLGGRTKLSCHRPVSGVRTPARMRSLSRCTVTEVASNVTMHPASHSCAMDNSDVVRRAGTMWTRRAAMGRLGRSSSASCVEYMMVPFGFAIPIGLEVGRMLITAAVTVQKCAVLPLSAIAKESAGGIGSGGPTNTLDKLSAETLETFTGKLVLLVARIVLRVGSPRRQLLAVGSWRGRPEEIVLLPPFMRKAVASSWWPSALWRHVMEV